MCIQRHHPPLIAMTGLTFSSAKELIQDPYACFRLITAKKYLALLPRYIGDLNKGVREQLDAELNLFSTTLNGVIVAYSNVRRFQQHGTILGSQPCLHIYIQADFIVFQPNRGSILRAVVNKVGRDYVGCLVHGCFNASISKRSLQQLNLAPNTNIPVGQTFLFQVDKYFANNAILSIRGSFYEDSFSENPLCDPVSEPPAMDQLDATTLEEEEPLPDIVHKKRRRSESQSEEMTSNKRRKSNDSESEESPTATSTVPAVTTGKPAFTQPADFTAALGTLYSKELESPKKKKKKHRHEKHEAAGNHIENGDQSSVSIDDSGIVVNSPDPSDVETSKKKKKKKDKRRDQQPELAQDTLHGNDESLSKKKKKKKSKHRDDPQMDNNVEDTNNVELGISDALSLDDSTSKKKKKKHRHKDE